MIYRTLKPLVLGSNSPRRREYLEMLGIVFEAYGACMDESLLPGEKPAPYVERMAREKGRIVGDKFPGKFVLTADTAVCIGSRILGKPADENEAVSMLMELSSKEHTVFSGICVRCEAEGVELFSTTATGVLFARFDEAVARAYVNLGESCDKAGAYGIQGAGAFLVERVSGSYSNVVGLPLVETITLLAENKVICPAG